MADLFEDAWRRAKIQLPAVDAMLVRDWAQDAYNDACTRRAWGWLRKESAISTLASRSVTAGVTQASATVTSTAEFVATDVGRQLRIGSYPFYTIIIFTDASTVILDRAYAGSTDAAATAQILDALVVMPADFSRFLVIADTYNQRPILFGASQDEVGIADPARTNSDYGPRFMVAATFSPVTATLGQVRYECWPLPTAARQFPFLYVRKAERLADTSSLPGVFSNRSDLLKLGCLMNAAGWPGTVDQKNPYYGLEHFDRLQKQWEFQLQKLQLEDDNQYPEDLIAVDWAREYYGLARNTRTLRMTDATVADYY
jgi:hypothetical protein